MRHPLVGTVHRIHVRPVVTRFREGTETRHLRQQTVVNITEFNFVRIPEALRKSGIKIFSQFSRFSFAAAGNHVQFFVVQFHFCSPSAIVVFSLHKDCNT